jgi:CHAT domain-containing protein
VSTLPAAQSTGAATVDAPVAVASTAPLFHSWSSTLERLPATAVEAEALSAFYASDQRLILTGPAATQQQFFSPAVRNARIIHIATHGYFNEQMPELVGFAMSKGHDDDGFVSMAEIAAERFSAELVVISACSTAQGETIAGEGNMSLARTFLAQGVGAVISTLWPISDRATAVFMKEFYRALNEDGASYAEALDSARQVLRATPAYRNPYYWSAYTLSSASSTAI